MVKLSLFSKYRRSSYLELSDLGLHGLDGGVGLRLLQSLQLRGHLAQPGGDVTEVRGHLLGVSLAVQLLAHGLSLQQLPALNHS